jgi:hypothetical protein
VFFFLGILEKKTKTPPHPQKKVDRRRQEGRKECQTRAGRKDEMRRDEEGWRKPGRRKRMKVGR